MSRGVDTLKEFSERHETNLEPFEHWRRRKAAMSTEAWVTWVYIKSEPRLYTVGFYKPDGKWEPESDYPSSEQAAARVHFLNGGATHVSE
jgi:hypothetical protein